MSSSLILQLAVSADSVISTLHAAKKEGPIILPPIPSMPDLTFHK